MFILVFIVLTVCTLYCNLSNVAAITSEMAEDCNPSAAEGEMCCGGNVFPMRFNWTCCNHTDKRIHTPIYKCPNGTLNSTDLNESCGNKTINLEFEQCCGGTPYDPKSSKCCIGSSKTSIPNKNDRCCNGEGLNPKYICCNNHTYEGPFLKQEPSHTKCCFTDGLLSTYDPKDSYCDSNNGIRPIPTSSAQKPNNRNTLTRTSTNKNHVTAHLVKVTTEEGVEILTLCKKPLEKCSKKFDKILLSDVLHLRGDVEGNSIKMDKAKLFLRLLNLKMSWGQHVLISGSVDVIFNTRRYPSLTKIMESLGNKTVDIFMPKSQRGALLCNKSDCWNIDI